MRARQDRRYDRGSRLNAGVADNGVLDPAFRVETPEGIELELQPAGLHARACAWLLDLLIRCMVIYIIALVTPMLAGLGVSFFLILLFLVEWLYPVAFELMPPAATPGKRLVGLRVVMTNGLPVTVGASLARNLLRAADFLPVLYATGAISVLLRHDFRRLGDLVADTLVVHAPRPASVALQQDIEPLPPLRPLGREAQSALVRLATRAGRINSERLDEGAAVAAPACGPELRAGPELTRRVLGVGFWLLGGRRE